jgi:hypothetical protein
VLTVGSSTRELVGSAGWELVGSSTRELVGSAGGVLVGSSTRELVGSAGCELVGSSTRELVGSAGCELVGAGGDVESPSAAAMAVPVIAPPTTTSAATANPIRVVRPRTCPPRTRRGLGAAPSHKDRRVEGGGLHRVLAGSSPPQWERAQ